MAAKGTLTGAMRTELTDRFSEAVDEARVLHMGDVRKGTQIPYFSHLLAVASLVLDDGGSEDEAVAAILHDAVEDQGGLPTAKLIRAQFGDRVAEIVLACSDSTDPDPARKAPWRERKEAYLAHLEAETDAGVLRVSLADKLHNARAILFDYRSLGPALWGRFSAGRDGQLWYYGRLVEIFAARQPGPLADELARVVGELRQLVAAREA